MITTALLTGHASVYSGKKRRDNVMNKEKSKVSGGAGPPVNAEKAI
jgi:hypothetical protein